MSEAERMGIPALQEPHALAIDENCRRERALGLECVISSNRIVNMQLAGVLECCAGGPPCADCRELLKRASEGQNRAALWALALARGL